MGIGGMEMKQQTSVAVLGLGAMGSRMAARLVSEDIELRVWSRSGVPSGNAELEKRRAPSASLAVQGAEVVMTMLTDDEASRSVWLDLGILDSMQTGATVLECSTVSPSWVQRLAEHARKQELAFLEAPVVGSRPQAEAGELIFLAGGDANIVERHKPLLLRMGRAVEHLGPAPAGAQTKLLVNGLLAVQIAALGELLGSARQSGMDLGRLGQALSVLPVMSPSGKGALAGMLAGAFAPQFPLELALKDLNYLASQTDPRALPLTGAAIDVYERGRAMGFSEENLTAVAKLY